MPVGDMKMFAFIVMYMCTWGIVRSTLPSECNPGDKSISIKVSAHYYQRSLLTAPSTEKTTDYARKFLSAYEAYSSGTSRPTTLSQSMNVPEAFPGPPPTSVPEAFPDLYQPFNGYVAADIDVVANAARSHIATNTSGSVIVEEIGSETFRRIETSSINTYISGFLQVIQRLKYHINIGGITATMEEETVYISVPVSSPLSVTELRDLGRYYISDYYSGVGGQIRGSGFLQKKCFSSLTEEETDRVAVLENRMNNLIGDLLTQAVQISNLETTGIPGAPGRDGVVGPTGMKGDEGETGRDGEPGEMKQTKFVKPPTGSLRPEVEGCLLTCVGSTGKDSTSWNSTSYGVWIYVYMTECGFTGTPVITASVDGISFFHAYMTQAVIGASSTRFQMYMRGWVLTTAKSIASSYSNYGTPTSKAASNNWLVNWSATGYTC